MRPREVIPLMDVGVGVAHAAVFVGVHVEVAALPADEEPDREQRDRRADGDLGDPLDAVGTSGSARTTGSPNPNRVTP